MDNVPLTMNAITQAGPNRLVVTVESPRGADESYLSDFANKGLPRCGANNLQRVGP